MFDYFSGMVFGVVAVFGHFGKTMLLFFLPQMLNLLYSAPQMVGWVPHAFSIHPLFDEKSKTYCMSLVRFKLPKNALTSNMISLLSRTKLLEVKRTNIDDCEYVEINNMTLTNLVVKYFGPLNGHRFVAYILSMQAIANCIGLITRYYLAGLLYGDGSFIFGHFFG